MFSVGHSEPTEQSFHPMLWLKNFPGMAGHSPLSFDPYTGRRNGDTSSMIIQVYHLSPGLMVTKQIL